MTTNNEDVPDIAQQMAEARNHKPINQMTKEEFLEWLQSLAAKEPATGSE